MGCRLCPIAYRNITGSEELLMSLQHYAVLDVSCGLMIPGTYVKGVADGKAYKYGEDFRMCSEAAS